ncbi:hypothetical protein CEP53_015374 [Fusarium sp. AF-6]|nr:hypothetical protein CEP53_015374 [Fusarium sp. AF-6]
MSSLIPTAPPRSGENVVGFYMNRRGSASKAGGNTCGGQICTTLTIYDSNAEDEEGAQYMVDCMGALNAPGSNKPYTKFYREYITDVTTSEISTATEASATTGDSTTTASTTSSTETETETDTGDPDTTKGLSGGAIAGIVVGAIAGLCLIACGFYIAYRMGRRRHGDPEGPRRGFMDSLRTIPRPNVNVTWTRPKGNAQPPVLLHTFTDDDPKKPREMLGDTEQSSQQQEVPPVELPAQHVVEMVAPTENGRNGVRTDAQ